MPKLFTQADAANSVAQYLSLVIGAYILHNYDINYCSYPMLPSLSAELTVFAAAMWCLGDLRLLMTNSGQAES